MANQVGQIRSGFDNTDLNNYKTEEKDVATPLGKFPKDGVSWIKLGIQAPPGSQWQINDKKILIGRTGMYELDDDIIVSRLQYLGGDYKNIIIDYLEKAKEEVSR